MSTKTASASTSRQSSAMVMAIRVQDDFSSTNSPPFIGTARRSLLAACEPQILSSQTGFLLHPHSHFEKGFFSL
ncbi:MAG: hypothetical protein WBD32_04850 [Acidobacteriaceae bacterium]